MKLLSMSCYLAQLHALVVQRQEGAARAAQQRLRGVRAQSPRHLQPVWRMLGEMGDLVVPVL